MRQKTLNRLTKTAQRTIIIAITILRRYSMKIKPLFDRIVIEPLDVEEKTKSGIVLLAKDQEKPQIARVAAVGPGGNVDGKDVTMVVKVGDKVLYSKYAGSEYKVDNKTFTVMRQSDVLAVVED